MPTDPCALDLGRMNKRVTLQQLVAGEDASGATEVWTNVVTRWAMFTSLRGQDAWRQGQFTSEKYVTITLRYLAGVTSNMRATYQGRNFTIQDAVDVNERHIRLDLLCVELDGK